MAAPNIPPEIQKRSKGVYLLCFGLSMVIVSTLPLYKRVVLGEERKQQQGEILPNGKVRIFDEYEREERDKNSIITKIFGTK